MQNTAEIGLFKIISESGIGAGTRRIEAKTSKGAYEFFEEKESQLQQAATLLKTKEDQVPQRIESLFYRNEVNTKRKRIIICPSSKC